MSTEENETPEEDQAAEKFEAFEEPIADEPSAADELETLKADNAELRDQLLRSQAELENFRRRSQKEALDAMKYQALPVVRSILPGIDNLQRAIQAAEQSGDTQGLIDGIKMVSQQFTESLKSNSCETISPEGQPFDANFHEALSQIPSADHEPMTVLQVIEVGYKIHDRVVRPAKVMVSFVPEEPAAQDSTGDDADAAAEA